MVAGVSGPRATASALSARPGTRIAPALPPGLSRLGLGGVRDGLVLLPANHAPGEPVPLLVMLHGAGGDADGAIALVREAAETLGVALLAPDSRGATWDLIRGGYGPDVAFLDAALGWFFERQVVDLARLAVGGFSDGASYALSLALSNGDLFAFGFAFSPGFAAPDRAHGRPRVFVSHGQKDGVLPIGPCSRTLVPRLLQAGYEVRYEEFDGGHLVPPSVARDALGWLADTESR